jgi:hypothetical protein
MSFVPAVKPTISLDPELHAEIEAAARAEGQSFSAWMAEAARSRLRSRKLYEVAAEVLAEQGGITQEDWDRAGEEMGLPPEPIPDGFPVKVAAPSRAATG